MDKPVLNPMQRSWLQEIGIDARMLAHFSMEPFADAAEAPASAEATAPVAAPPVAGAARTQPAMVQPAQAGSPLREAPGVSEPSPPAAARDDGRRGQTPGATLLADLLNRKPLTRRPPAQPPQTGAVQREATVSPAHALSLQELREHAEQCQACSLHEVRARVVFGEGAETAVQWMFIGEAPGGHDDMNGKPFQGRPGELLRAMLASVDIDAAAPAYFTNVLKCRPMGNRSPEPEEVAACMPLLRRQIQLLQPVRLVALGRVAAGALLGRDDDLESLRGRVHDYRDEDGNTIPLVVTHHPASLLLHGQLKAEAWRDLNLLVGLDS